MAFQPLVLYQPAQQEAQQQGADGDNAGQPGNDHWFSGRVRGAPVVGESYE
jgi:hypothetical protein